MSKFGVWQIHNHQPVKVNSGFIDLEMHLERWIESDPAMLPGSLEVVAKQMVLEGGRLDLLGLDPLGRWVVIELKAGEVNLSTFTQALYYSAQIEKMPFDVLQEKIDEYLILKGKRISDLLLERGITGDDQNQGKEILLYLVGTKKSLGMDNLMDYITTKTDFSTSLIVFEVFDLTEDKQILVRELSEQEVVPMTKAASIYSARNIDELLDLADRHGIGHELRALHQASWDHGFYARPYKHAIMYTSPQNRTRMLYTVVVDKKPMQVYVGYDAFLDYFPVDEAQLNKALGDPGWKFYEPETIAEFISGLESLGIDVNNNI